MGSFFVNNQLEYYLTYIIMTIDFYKKQKNVKRELLNDLIIERDKILTELNLKDIK